MPKKCKDCGNTYGENDNHVCEGNNEQEIEEEAKTESMYPHTPKYQRKEIANLIRSYVGGSNQVAETLIMETNCTGRAEHLKSLCTYKMEKKGESILYVASCQFSPRDSSAWQSWSLSKKKAAIRQLVEVAYKKIKSRVKKTDRYIDARINWLFVMPEYTFSEADKGEKRGHMQMSEGNQRRVKAFMAEISLSYIDLLFIPGSIAYKKKFSSGDIKKSKSRRQRIYYGHENYLNVLRSAKNAQDAEISRVEDQSKGYTTRRDKSRKEYIGEGEMGRNTAYAYYRGQKVIKSHKRGDIGEEAPLTEKNLYFARGTETQIWRLDEKELSFAVQICADAATNRVTMLKDKPDIQVIVANGLGLNAARIESRQYTIIADEAGGENDPFVVDSHIRPVKPFAKDVWKESKAGYMVMRYYALPVKRP